MASIKIIMSQWGVAESALTSVRPGSQPSRCNLTRFRPGTSSSRLKSTTWMKSDLTRLENKLTKVDLKLT